MPTPQIGIRIPENLEAELTARAGTVKAPRNPNETDRSSVLRRDALRYYDLLARARRQLRDLLTPDDCALIVAALSSTFLDDSILYHLDEEVCEWLEDEEAGAPGLAVRLRSLDPAALVALGDAVERLRAGKGDARRLLEEPAP